MSAIYQEILEKTCDIMAAQRAEIEALKESQKKLNNTIQWFKEQTKLEAKHKFDRTTDNSHQLSLFDEHESDEVKETIESISDTQEQVTLSRPKKKNGRNIDTSKLPRERREYDLTEEEKTCQCGCQMHKIGEDTSETLEHIPEQLKVIEHVKHKYACRKCETIKATPKEEQPIAKCMAGSSLLANVIVKKFEHHLPLYRQSKIYEQNGIDIPDNTLGNWVSKSSEVLKPLGDALWNEIVESNYLQADESPVKVLKPDKKGYMWGYHNCESGRRCVAFEFNLSRSGTVPESRLQGFTGRLQTDGYSGYNSFRHSDHVKNIGCWDHARRKVTDTIKVASGDMSGVSGDLLQLINKLYKIEKNNKSSSEAERYEVRQTFAIPILDKIFNIANKSNRLPKSMLGQAITYLKNNEQYLREYANTGDAHISNILAENQIRPLALGRKNWLFVGNEESANKSALLYSLIQSAKMNHINAQKYLTAVLKAAPAMRRGEVDPRNLLPQYIDHQLLK